MSKRVNVNFSIENCIESLRLHGISVTSYKMTPLDDVDDVDDDNAFY